jgi:hypothetical protein
MGLPAVVSTTPWRFGADTTIGREVAANLRALILAGIPVGVFVGGVVSRLAMFVLRLTSPERVRGVESDDGFTIGEFTLGGTYSLLLLGAAVGLIGAGFYRLVAPWLIGPTWFRRVTVGLACAAVVGALLVHDDGVDFHLLEPTWLAIALFVAVPGLFGLLIGPAVDWVLRDDERSRHAKRRWLVAVGLVAVFPLTLFVLAFLTPAVWCAVVLRRTGVLERLRSSTVAGFAVRGVLLLVAFAGLLALIRDIGEIV